MRVRTVEEFLLELATFSEAGAESVGGKEWRAEINPKKCWRERKKEEEEEEEWAMVMVKVVMMMSKKEEKRKERQGELREGGKCEKGEEEDENAKE